MTHAVFVSVPLEALAAALGSCPDDLRPTLELAERLGAVRLRGGRVELPGHAAALGLVRRPDGRWATGPNDPGGPGRRGRTLPLLFEGTHPDPRAEEPWQELARGEEPPPDRVAALGRWLDSYSRGLPPPAPGGGPEGDGAGRRPGATAPAYAVDRAKPGRRTNIDLAALRARLDAAVRAAG